MKSKINLGIRVLIGLLLISAGFDKWFHFMPMPPKAPAGEAFMAAITATGYFFPVVGLFEVVIGLMLVSGYYIPLALILLAPFSINFVLFHLFLDIGGIVPGLIIALVNAYLAWEHRASYLPLLKLK